MKREVSGAAIPAGYVIVPIEPTEAMIEAACEIAIASMIDDDEVRALWSAMLTAAPKPEAPTIPAGMKPWGPDSPGYPNAPADWDSGDVLLRNGAKSVNAQRWAVGYPSDLYNPVGTDIIAYTPKAASADGDARDVEGAIRIAVWNACRSHGMSDDTAIAVVKSAIAELAALRSQPAGEG